MQEMGTSRSARFSFLVSDLCCTGRCALTWMSFPFSRTQCCFQALWGWTWIHLTLTLTRTYGKLWSSLISRALCQACLTNSAMNVVKEERISGTAALNTTPHITNTHIYLNVTKPCARPNWLWTWSSLKHCIHKQNQPWTSAVTSAFTKGLIIWAMVSLLVWRICVPSAWVSGSCCVWPELFWGRRRSWC